MPIADRPVTQQAKDVAQATQAAIPPSLFAELLDAEARLARTTFDPERFFLQGEVPKLEAAYRASTNPSQRRIDAEAELAAAAGYQALMAIMVPQHRADVADLNAATARLVRAQTRTTKARVEETLAIKAVRDERAAALAPVSAKKLAMFAILTAPAWGAYLLLRR